ncbi:hypothetical protein Zmor_011446 [Zophobas morio]|uniref:Chitin-binding type-2 domain-containing protein n=1 Tax=Zophobas morio TaxID=2755281 RepID=A0AA38IKQ5_9CUCU|nr:hypothetical protein Zmor_011446 [Zophobas morio]
MFSAIFIFVAAFVAISTQTDPICPVPDGDNPIRYLPAEDCTKFYDCSDGTPVLYDCPDGLYFNPVLQVCDWPENSGCKQKTD